MAASLRCSFTYGRIKHVFVLAFSRKYKDLISKYKHARLRYQSLTLTGEWYNVAFVKLKQEIMDVNYRNTLRYIYVNNYLTII